MERSSNVTWQDGNLSRAQRLAIARASRGDRMADRPARIGQVDDRRGARGATGQIGPLRVPARWRQHAPRSVRQTSASATPIGRRTSRGSASSRGCSPTPVRSRSSLWCRRWTPRVARCARVTSAADCGSSRCSSTPRSRCAWPATRRRCTREPGQDEIHGFTGVDAPYEPPSRADLTLTAEHRAYRAPSAPCSNCSTAPTNRPGRRERGATRSGRRRSLGRHPSNPRTERSAEMKLIGAGLPRTGTLSQKIALEMLGLRPVTTWSTCSATSTRPSGGARCSTRSCRSMRSSKTSRRPSTGPGRSSTKELIDVYPDAKVLLSVRERRLVGPQHARHDLGRAVRRHLHSPHVATRGRDIDPKWDSYMSLMDADVERAAA